MAGIIRKIDLKLLRDSEARFRTIFEQAPMGICLSDSITGQIVELNERFAQIAGRTSEELRKMDWMSITHPDDLQEDMDQMALLNAQKITDYNMNKRYLKPDGSIVWIDMSIVTFKAMESANPLRICMIEDITQRKLSEAALKKSEGRLKTAQSIANVGNWELNLSMNRVWFSEQAFKIYGIRQKSSHLTLKAVQDLVCREDRPKLDRALQLLSGNNESYDVEFKIIRVDDARERILHSIAVTENDENGKPIKVLGTIQDITEIKNAEQALAQSHSMLKATLQSTADGILAVDLDGKISFYNEQYRKMWGLPEQIFDQGDDKAALDFIKDKLVDPEAFFSRIPKFNKQANLEISDVVDLKDGKTIERYSVPQWRDGKIVGLVLSFRDISERKRSEQALIASEAKHKAMIANISDGIAIIDQNGLIKYKNPNLESWFGWGQKDSLESVVWAFVHPDDQKLIQLEFQDLLKKDGLVKTVEYRHKNKNGIYMNIQLTGVNMLHDANINGVLLNFHDITESKKREERILYLSYHDQLTGLYNRRFYEEELKRLDTKRNLPMTIVMGDVNGLKRINDSFGHTMGDELLRKVTEVIKRGCRADDIIARLGGDEFVIMLPKTDAFETEKIIKRINDLSLKEKVRNIVISISFGYETKKYKDENIQEVFKKAEDQMYRHKLSESASVRSKMVDLIVNTLYEKSNREQLHSIKVSEICEAIATRMNFNKGDVSQIRIAGLMHDIGKIEIDDKILNKPQGLNQDEWEEIKRHPEIGYRILSTINEFSEIAEYVLEHQERWDGKGYPRGLKGEDISLQARIIAVADAFDAMTCNRVYGKVLSEKEAINEIRRCSGTQFDPEIARVFVEKVLRKEWE